MRKGPYRVNTAKLAQRMVEGKVKKKKTRKAGRPEWRRGNLPRVSMHREVHFHFRANTATNGIAGSTSLLRQRIKDLPNAFDAYSSTFETCAAWEPQPCRAERGWREILARNSPGLKWATEAVRSKIWIGF